MEGQIMFDRQDYTDDDCAMMDKAGALFLEAWHMRDIEVATKVFSMVPTRFREDFREFTYWLLAQEDEASQTIH